MIRPWPWPDDEGREGGLFALFDGVRTQANRARGKKKSLVLEKDEEHHD